MTKRDVSNPVVLTAGKRIVQVGIVVRDAARTAKRWAELLGLGPWSFIDIAPTDIVLHDERLDAEEACIRVALANLGSLQIELLEPLCGPSTHREFLQAHGEGIHHLSFGRIPDHDDVVAGLQRAGIGIEMQGVMGNAGTFTYLATQERLGTIFEFVKPGPLGGPLPPWGRYAAPRPGVVNLAGKKVAQVGIVVGDAERAAREYWELLGIGPWTLIDFKRPYVTEGALHGIAMTTTDFHVRAALADHEGLQFELIEPVYGPSTHMEFLKTHGQGIHHLSFGAVPDHDHMVAALERHGCDVEATALLGGAVTVTYMATQQALGTLFEVLKTHPGVEMTIKPYGSYPPEKAR